MGIGDILLYIRMERFIGFGPVISLISGIVSVMAGIMLVVYPGAGVMVLSVLFPIWFIAHCISRLSHAGTIRLFSGNGMYYTTLILNGVGLGPWDPDALSFRHFLWQRLGLSPDST